MKFAAYHLLSASCESSFNHPRLTRGINMKIILLAAGVTASLLAGSAFAGTPTPLGQVLGSALPLAGAGLFGVGAASLIAGIRMLRRKNDR
ncbi:MAG: hypothetical protein ACXWU7_16115 [Telluria sp.]